MSEQIPLRLAFLGFQHNHVLGLYQMAQRHPAVRIVAACEEDPRRAQELARSGTVELTHTDIAAVLASVPCDAVAVGDYYGRRGSLVIQALQAGKHVICDKPLCTDLAEWRRIQELATGGNLKVGCLLDLRGSGAFRAMRRLIREGAIGEVHTISFSAQHPLLLGSRPHWYFEPGKHGGTINDIAVHGIDLVPWMTGRKVAEVVAARAWNARLKEYPHFQDAAQFMLRLDNDGGLLADVSYLAPDGCGYAVPQYWRFTCHGEHGVLEASADSSHLMLAKSEEPVSQSLPVDASEPSTCLEAFLAEITADSGEGMLKTTDVLQATYECLMIQRKAIAGLSLQSTL